MDKFYIDRTDEKFNIVMQIRNEVFEKEQGAIASQEIDLYDESDKTIYLLLYDGDSAVATGRIAFTDSGVKIGRIAVVSSQRGKGVGAVLVSSLCEKAQNMGAKFVLVDAQLHAIKFYEKLGFKSLEKPEIIDRGIRHLPMVKWYE